MSADPALLAVLVDAIRKAGATEDIVAALVEDSSAPFGGARHVAEFRAFFRSR
jgi:hypothetical protein